MMEDEVAIGLHGEVVGTVGEVLAGHEDFAVVEDVVAGAKVEEEGHESEEEEEELGCGNGAEEGCHYGVW